MKITTAPIMDRKLLTNVQISTDCGSSETRSETVMFTGLELLEDMSVKIKSTFGFGLVVLRKSVGVTWQVVDLPYDGLFYVMLNFSRFINL